MSEDRAMVGPRPLLGRVRVPGDKSISHRALLLAAVARGESRLRGLATGDDVTRTRAAIEALGVEVEDRDGEVIVHGRGWDALRAPEATIECGNSGTSIRLLCGLLAGRPFAATLTGDASVARRPMGRVVEPLRLMGARIDGRDGGEHTPLTVEGGHLQGISYELPVASAQVKSALMLAGLQADGTTEIREPAPSRDHTERMLASMGVALDVTDGVVRVRRSELSPLDLDVPGDPSSAAFFVAGAVVTRGSDLVVEGVALNPSRLAFVDALRRMGADVEVIPVGERCGEPVGDLRARTSSIEPTELAGPEIPALIDEIPALALVAAFADGETDVRDARELRFKESDRIGTIEQELSQMGISVRTRRDGFVIRGGRPRPGLFKSHGDHRIAMMTAMAANACEGESWLRGWEAVASSYPGFFVDLERVAGGAE